LKRWMRDWVRELLGRFHNSWIADLSSTSLCLVPVLFLQQKISVSRHILGRF